jgi:MFS family permease
MFLFTLGNSSDAFMLKRAEDLGVPGKTLPLLWLALHLVKSSGSLVAGAWVNRLGSKRMIAGGWAIYALVYVAMSQATAAWQIWGLFLIYGVYYALTEPVEKKLVADQRSLWRAVRPCGRGRGLWLWRRYGRGCNRNLIGRARET